MVTPLPWNFPDILYPHTKVSAKTGLVYNLVGCVLIKQSLHRILHFIVRPAQRNDKNTVFTYDGMLHNGQPKVEMNAKFSTHIAGKEIPTLDGFRPYQYFYYLQGGLKAQEELYKIRIKTVAKQYRIEFTQPNPQLPPQVIFPTSNKHLKKLPHPTPTRSIEYVPAKKRHIRHLRRSLH